MDPIWSRLGMLVQEATRAARAAYLDQDLLSTVDFHFLENVRLDIDARIAGRFASVQCDVHCGSQHVSYGQIYEPVRVCVRG